MKLDPKQLFVISQISRADIAVMLNDAIDAAGASDVDRFIKGDERLTDDVCREIADLVYDAECQNDEDHATQAAADTFLGSMPARLRKRAKPPAKKRTGAVRGSRAPVRTGRRR